MGRMAEISKGYGDAATFPVLAKHPELDVSDDSTELFMFTAKIGCGDKPVDVVAKVYADGQCEEIAAVLARGIENITDYLTSDTLDELCKLAETKFHAQQQEDAS